MAKAMSRGQDGQSLPDTAPQAMPPGKQAVPRLLERYRQEIAPTLLKTFQHTNSMAVARLNKIVLNMGCGEAAHDAKYFEAAQKDLALIAGQQPVVTRAKQAISNFKIKEGDPVGAKVTLRRARMYEFLDRLLSIALPRIRDFRGLDLHGFDQAGNYSFGIAEHTIFPEIHPDHSPPNLGLDIAVVIRAKTREESIALLKGFGFPFAIRY